MTETYRVLVIDDNPEALQTVRDRLEVVSAETGVHFEVDAYSSFSIAEDALLKQRYDFAVVDLRDDSDTGSAKNDAGLLLFDKLRNNFFVPVIFHTAYKDDFDGHDRELPFVRVAPKDDPTSVDGAVLELVGSGILDLARDLHGQVEGEVRRYLWEQDSTARVDAVRNDLKSVLFRRVSARLDVATPSVRVNASRMYLHPPLSEEFACGDVIRWDGKWSVLLTPACDLVSRNGRIKARYLRFVRAETVQEIDALAGKSKEAELSFLKDAHSGRTPRHLFLPAFMDIPRLVLDFQQVATPMAADCIDKLAGGAITRVATLDAPYVEELLVRSSNYSGRIGSPDLADRAFEDLPTV